MLTVFDRSAINISAINVQIVTINVHSRTYRHVSCWIGTREKLMRYIIAWLLGVPFSIIVLWYIVAHTACG